MFSQKNNFLQDTLRFCNGERMIIDLLQPLDKSASLFWKTPDTQIENTKKIEAILFDYDKRNDIALLKVNDYFDLY